jgi:fission 1 protein
MFKSNVYPALEELKQPLSAQQLQILKSQLESENPNPSPQSQFNYAWGLIKSSNHKHVASGIEILRHLYQDNEDLKRECLYYLSLGSYKIGEYGRSRQYVEKLLEIDPNNMQAMGLKTSIEDKITNDGLIGLGIGTGAVAIGVGVLVGILGRKRK